MNIGILALLIGALCSVVTLATHSTDDKTSKAPDYTGIYAAIAPREI